MCHVLVVLLYTKSLVQCSQQAVNIYIMHKLTCMHVGDCRPMSITAARATHSLLYAVNLSFSYLLMLAVMTFNVGFFFVIVLGLALGNFLFGGSSKSSDVCHTQS